jgi:hypothetical protein
LFTPFDGSTGVSWLESILDFLDERSQIRTNTGTEFGGTTLYEPRIFKDGVSVLFDSNLFLYERLGI